MAQQRASNSYPDYPDPGDLSTNPYPTLEQNVTDQEIEEEVSLPTQDGLADVQSSAQKFYDDFGPPSTRVSTFENSRQLLETDLESDSDDDEQEDFKSQQLDVEEFDVQTDLNNKDLYAKARKRGWRQFLKGTAHESLGKHERSGQPRKKYRRKKRKVDPGREFKEALSRASQEFMAGKLDDAADYARVAIEQNPEVFAAYSLLSEVLKAQGHEEDSIECLRLGAYSSKSPHVWLNILERILDLVDEDPREDYMHKALDCAREALKLRSVLDEDTHYVIVVHRLRLFRQLGDTLSARRSAKVILKRWPGDIRVCRELAELTVESGDRGEMQLAKEYYDKAIELKKDQPTIDDEDDPWRHVLAYADIVSNIQGPMAAIASIKDLGRWILNRKNETFWLQHVNEDDREFDLDNERRDMIEEFRQGLSSRDPTKFGQGLPIEARVRLGLLRIRRGPADHEEALRHFSHLMDFKDSIEYYYDLYLQVVGSLREHGRNKDAEQYYDVLQIVPDVIDEDVWMHMGLCYDEVDRRGDAAECYEEVLKSKGSCFGWASAHLARWHEDEGNFEEAKSLCDLVMKLGRRDLLRAANVKNIPPPPLQLQRFMMDDDTTSQSSDIEDGSQRDLVGNPSTATEGIFSEIPVNPTKSTGKGPRKERQKRRKELSKPTAKKPLSLKKTTVAGEERVRELQDARERIHADFITVKKHWHVMKSGEDSDALQRWVAAAHRLLDEFLAMKIFFPDRDKAMQLSMSRNEERMFTRLPVNSDNTNAPSEFQGISFHEWHRLCVDLALHHARIAEKDECLRIFQECILQANAFWQIPELETTGYAAAICVGIMLNDGTFIVELGRKLITQSDSRSPAAFQLFGAMNRLLYGNSALNSGPSQKFMLRAVKQSDYLAMPPDRRAKHDFAMHKKSLEERLRKRSHTAHSINAHAIMVYGYMVAVSNFAFSALPYFYRALALDQDNVVVNLSIATMWVQNSMKRQTQNRHFGVTQGLAFLYRYYELRVASGRSCHIQEAEYNVARMWHFLGLMHLAVPGYEKVLKLSARVQQERFHDDNFAPTDEEVVIEDYASEAAFALQGIYATMGNDEEAGAITEEWLCI